MAPDEPNQKWKRGRPAVASKNADTASEREVRRRGQSQKINKSVAEEEAPAAENQGTPDTAPKKRGRPGKKSRDAEPGEAQNAEEKPDESAQSADMAPKKRGWRPRNQDAEAKEVEPIEKHTNEPAQSPDVALKKRGRRARNQDIEPEDFERAETRPRKRIRGSAAGGEENNLEAGPSSRGKPGKKSRAPKEAEVSENQDATETVSRSRRRGRTANMEESMEEALDEANKQGEASKKRAGRHPKEPEPTPEEPPARRRARGRRSADESTSPATRTRKTTETSPEEPQTENQPKKSKRGRTSLAEVSVSKAQNKSAPPPEVDTTTTAQTKKKRGTGNSSQQPQPEPPKEPPTYTTLTTLTRSIPRSTISSKWTPLPQPSISQIQSLVSDSARPVLLRLRETPRQDQASTILRTFSTRLNTKLVKGMPFPPAQSLDEQLDFEKTLDTIQALEKQLDPLLHSVALLKAEKEKEEAKLEADYKALKELEGNARAQRGGWRERMRKNRKHGLVPERGDDDDEEGKDESWVRGLEVMKRDSKVGFGGVFKGLGGEDEEDEEVELLAKQIASHMESMKGNLSQVDGLVGKIGKGRAALQGVLGKYLSEEAYESVVLG
ncbi:CENP-Q, a CENPA-CAD centromere complex subunit-domain-containing protein [Cladorrhinum sp. PSN332]|nr:CENP-Q, a CENPA-CAD centromere complex subunit-domain-containing protein [Cladorrhinum sp. PSN332]